MHPILYFILAVVIVSLYRRLHGKIGRAPGWQSPYGRPPPEILDAARQRRRFLESLRVTLPLELEGKSFYLVEYRSPIRFLLPRGRPSVLLALEKGSGVGEATFEESRRIVLLFALYDHFFTVAVAKYLDLVGASVAHLSFEPFTDNLRKVQAEVLPGAPLKKLPERAGRDRERVSRAFDRCIRFVNGEPEIQGQVHRYCRAAREGAANV